MVGSAIVEVSQFSAHHRIQSLLFIQMHASFPHKQKNKRKTSY